MKKFLESFLENTREYLPESLDIATVILVDSLGKQYIHFICQCESVS